MNHSQRPRNSLYERLSAGAAAGALILALLPFGIPSPLATGKLKYVLTAMLIANCCVCVSVGGRRPLWGIVILPLILALVNFVIAWGLMRAQRG